jgi:hypothetical protein
MRGRSRFGVAPEVVAGEDELVEREVLIRVS